jgi:iron complex outermembrane recepter protein
MTIVIHETTVSWRCYIRILAILFLIFPLCISAQTGFSPRQIKRLSVEELMNLDVTLVSRTPEKLTTVASAIQVITSEDIRRSAATNVPEALRLASNLQVSQLSSSVWIISARGFNSVFSNKLLVMIDGRTIYTPLYGGVLWEQQNVLLEDVERIEVVSGPGGTLWGANAVNGVINIITKHTSQTKGLYASVAAGNFLQDMASLRYGGNIGKKGGYKVYVQHFDRNETTLPNGTKNADAWNLTQAGFRTDWNATAKDAFAVQGDYYAGKRDGKPSSSSSNGQNILGRWTRTIGDSSGVQLQLYFDRYYRRDAPTSSSDEMNTIDLDFQHHFIIGRSHSIVWGAGYRYVKDNANFSITAGAGIVPRFKRLDLFNSFIQDEISLTKTVKLTIGTKLLHNVYTELEWQPNVRLAWQTKKSSLWGAVSRAVRTPSRFDVDYFLPMTPQPPNIPSVAGGPNFISEKMIAYEAGFRFQPNAFSLVSLTTFYNIYRDVYSVEPLPGTFTYQIQNGSKAESWGFEISGSYQLHKSWRVRGGYTYFNKDIRAEAGHVFDPSYLGNDARNIAMLQSILDLPLQLQLDITARHVDGLKKSFATARVPAYFTMDARLAFTYKGFELSVAGQNLTQKEHTEFGTFNLPRHGYAKISARF